MILKSKRSINTGDDEEGVEVDVVDDEVVVDDDEEDVDDDEEDVVDDDEEGVDDKEDVNDDDKEGVDTGIFLDERIEEENILYNCITSPLSKISRNGTTRSLSMKTVSCST
jgi:hypothetical protein